MVSAPQNSEPEPLVLHSTVYLIYQKRIAKARNHDKKERKDYTLRSFLSYGLKSTHIKIQRFYWATLLF
ncbi:hypothetical protein CDL62_04320 [Alkalitalea saponilacus]|nr:hypothetical protein CDL62_04320 [Alkalitalea saponilacus]